MPELPEAETVRRQLEPQVVDARILQTWARTPRITKPNIDEFVITLQNARILSAKRRGKQIYFPLDNGFNLLIHLGMTGRLHIEYSNAPFDAETLHKHVHGVLILEGDKRLVFTDPRMFGALGVSRDLPFLTQMGPEPLDDDFDAEELAQGLSARKTKIKTAILDQKIVAGLGNIYADEVCFLANIHPATRACDVSIERLRVLVSHMKPVLERAIAARGATLKDGGYQDTFGEYGEFIPQVYGQTKNPCTVCETPIVRGVLGNSKTARSYHFCPNCQKEK